MLLRRWGETGSAPWDSIVSALSRCSRSSMPMSSRFWPECQKSRATSLIVAPPMLLSRQRAHSTTCQLLMLYIAGCISCQILAGQNQPGSFMSSVTFKYKVRAASALDFKMSWNLCSQRWSVFCMILIFRTQPTWGRGRWPHGSSLRLRCHSGPCRVWWRWWGPSEASPPRQRWTKSGCSAAPCLWWPPAAGPGNSEVIKIFFIFYYFLGGSRFKRQMKYLFKN